MDSITQAALGAAIGEAVLGKKIGGKGALLGAAVATIPDLDILLYPLLTDLQRISVHRGFSHSFLFSFLGAILLVFLFRKLKWSKQLSAIRLFWFSWLALVTHIILDAFTSYGTQLFLPFSDYRVSLNSITIIDPVYTVPLLIGLLFSLYIFRKANNRRLYNYLGLTISTLYLLFTLVNKNHVENIYENQLAAQGISYNRLMTVPVVASNVVWYGVAKNEEGLYIGKYSEVTPNEIQFDFFPTNEYLLKDLDGWLVDRLKWFSQGYYIVAENNGIIRLYNMQCDMQGVRQYGNFKAPTAFYFEIIPGVGGDYELKTGMHKTI